MRSTLLILVAAVGLVAFERAHAADDQQAPATGAVATSSSAPAGATAHQPEVIVKAQRAELTQRISTFVNLVTDFNLGDPTRGLARWTLPVCPLVSGFPKQWGEYILGRISEVGQAAGVPLSKEHCHPNLYVLVSKHPDALLRDLQKRHNEVVFGGADARVVEGFIATSKPVKTWYNTAERTSDGLPLQQMSFPGMSQTSATAGLGTIIVFPEVPKMAPEHSTDEWAQASHLTLNVVWAIYEVFVIVDPTQFKGVSLGQLADYICMAGLAQLRLDTRLEDVPSILTLFDKRPQDASPGMTDWDRAFLKSVYSSEQKSVVQRSAIARGMIADIVH